MYLKDRKTDRLVEVLTTADLFNPMHQALIGRYHYGEEAQDPERFEKKDLLFTSGEALPQCWIDVHYRDAEAHRRTA